MNGSLGTLLPSSVPSSLSSAVTSPEDERRCAPFSVGDEHAAVSRAASPAPIKVLLSTLVGSCPLPGLLWLAEAWSVIIERASLSVLRDSIETRVWSEIACIQSALPVESQPHDRVTSHEIDELRCRAGRRVDAVQDRRYQRGVDGGRHTDHVPFTIKRQVHEKLRGASWTHTGKGSGCLIDRVE